MSIRFAGSRFVHERRRRRLAQECGGISVVAPSEDLTVAAVDSRSSDAPASTIGHSPVNSIIRPQLWVHWTITILCALAWVGMLYLGDLAERTGAGLRDILGIRSGRLTTFFSTMMLLWAGQLALLIYWYRRKSRNDFAGRYRIWLWIGGMLQLFLVIVATGAHRPFAAYMQRIWPVEVPQYGLICWLVPAATLSVTMYRLLRIELKRHRSGLFLLNVAVSSGTVAALTLIVGGFLPERLRDLVQVGSSTLSHLCLATSLLMHARYVVHVSNEAPKRERRRKKVVAAAISGVANLPITQSFTGVAKSWGKLRIRMPRLPSPIRTLRLKGPRRLAGETGSRIGSGTTHQKDAGTGSHTTSEPTRNGTEADRQKTKRLKRKATQRVDGPEQAKGPRGSSHRSSERSDAVASAEVTDQDSPSGLSKKQRRRLRKKRRELQRSTH